MRACVWLLPVNDRECVFRTCFIHVVLACNDAMLRSEG